VTEVLYPSVDDVLEVGFAATGKPVEVRDAGLLLGALQRPAQTIFGEDAYSTLWDKAAALLHSFTRNHALIDGNKRTGLALAVTFLLANDAITVREVDETDGLAIVLDVAQGKLEDVELIAIRLKEWLA
jgi:death on curing protein